MTGVATDGPEDFPMSFPSNLFCWHGIATDIDQGSTFYPNALGWKITAEGDGPPMCVAPGGPVAHLEAPENGPPAWCSYLSVDDLDASTALAADQGGTIVVSPTDLPVGRFSVVTTPSGAGFGLYQPDESDALAAPGPGSIHGVELHSTAPERDAAWFASVFGFTPTVTRSRTDTSAFVAWVQVDDLNATLAKVATHGGTPVGDAFAEPSELRRALVSDPSGARFGLIQPEPR